MTNTPEYRVWRAMKNRCRSPRTPAYRNYGKRGLRYDPVWESFEQFYADMGQRPPGKLSIERRDNSQGYSKANCYWGTIVDQNNNKRTNHRVTFEGRTMTIAQWGRALGVSRITIKNRLRRGWPIHLALSQSYFQGQRRFLTGLRWSVSSS